MSTTRDTGLPIRRTHQIALALSLFCTTLLLGACGSDDDDNDGSSSSSSSSSSSAGGNQNDDKSGGVTGTKWPEINVQSNEPKQLQFSWTPVEGADHYVLLKNPGDGSGFVQVGESVTEPSIQETIAVHEHDWANARYIVEACMDAECSDSEDSQEQITTSVMLDAIGYLKSSNSEAYDWFGWSLALSADGETLAVSAPREASQAQGIGGAQDDNSVFAAGAVYIFTLANGQWEQQAYVKASNTEQASSDDDEDTTITNDRFGFSLALSDSGDTLAVGAIGEDGEGLGVNPEEDGNMGPETGAVYLFQRTEGVWAETALLKASNATPAEDEETDEEIADEDSGEATDEETDEDAELELPTNAGDRFGHRVALSGDGSTVAVSSIYESSSASEINGEEDNNEAPAAGAVYVFAQNDEGWSQQAYVKASNNRRGNVFGSSLALSADGNTMAVGAPLEPNGERGINGTETGNNLPGTGAVYLFEREDTSWSQQAYIKPSHTYTDLPFSARQQGIGQLRFGTSLSLSQDGNRLAVGSPGDLTNSTGTDAQPDDYDFSDSSTIALDSGAVFLFSRNGDEWTESGYFKPSNTIPNMRFGRNLALSGEGEHLVVGAWRERSAEKGIDGDGLDTSVARAGAAYLFTLSDDAWSEAAYIKASNTRSGQNFGVSTSIDADGQTIAIGAHRESSEATGINGDRDDTSAADAGAVYLY